MKKFKCNYWYQDSLCTHEYEYPPERKLLEIFPEAKKIISQKIKEWEERKKKIIEEETKPFFEKCNSLKDEFSKAFWKECYAYLADGFNETMWQLKRLHKLEGLLKAPGGGIEKQIHTAKNRPIFELFEFERVRRAGKNIVARCPFHKDRTPSFYIYDTNSFYCFSCHKGGDSIDFIKALHNLGFREAISYIVGGTK